MAFAHGASAHTFSLDPISNSARARETHSLCASVPSSKSGSNAFGKVADGADRLVALLVHVRLHRERVPGNAAAKQRQQLDLGGAVHDFL